MVRKFTSADGLDIVCGENAGENEQLVRNAKQRDLWFHLETQPSAHVLLSVTGKGPAPRDSIHDAQQICKYFSAREASASRIIFIEAKAVSNPKESKTGTVELKKQPSKASVVYDESAIQRLLATKK
jgi:predicted ribosome quality control (RQC) complex YloA/Tae2 family protein